MSERWGFWMLHLSAIEAEGITTKAYAEREGLSAQALYGWRKVSVKPAASFPRAFRSGEFLPSLIEHGRPGDGQGGNGALASA